MKRKFILEYIYDKSPLIVGNTHVNEEYEEFTDAVGRSFIIKQASRGKPIGAFVAIGANVIGVCLVSRKDYYFNLKRSRTADIAYGRALAAEGGKFFISKDPTSITNKVKNTFFLPKQFREQYDNFVERSKKYFQEGK